MAFVRHGHIHPSIRTVQTSHLSRPIGYNETLESKFAFQEAVQRFAVLAPIRAVQPLVGTHNGANTGVDGVLKWP
jgi:hypothetical protein